MKLLHDIREAVRLLRAGELAVLRGRILGLHVEVTMRPYDPAVTSPDSGFSFSGEMSSEELRLDFDVDHARGSAWLSRELWARMGEVAGWMRGGALVPTEPEEPASGQVQRDDARCTGWEAVWCPLHGNCCCPYVHDREELGRTRESPLCPLHADWSQHADPHGGGAA